MQSDLRACFYAKVCRNVATLEKQGKTVCRECADRLPGTEYPLRSGRWRPEDWYMAAKHLEMVERGRAVPNGRYKY